MRRFNSVGVLALLALAAFLPATALAGTQDFTLVNNTGFTIYEVYVSETANNDWEEDVLAEDVLPDGERGTIGFSNRAACLWDIKVVDEEDTEVIWTGLNLCKASVVVLSCDDAGECTAEWE